MLAVDLPQNPPAVIEFWPTHGVSPEAQSIVEKYREGLDRLKQAASYDRGLSAAYAELTDIEKECKEPGWDGHDAMPVHPLSVALARQFLETLPLGFEAPSISAEPDGQVSMEWYRSPSRILSVSLSPDGELHYASLFGSSRRYGSEPFSGPIPESVLELAAKIMG